MRINSSKRHALCWALAAALSLFYFLLCKSQGFLQYRFDNDEPSYHSVSFHSATDALSSHRTIGLPLFLKLFDRFATTPHWWPTYQFVWILCALSGAFFLLKRTGFHWLTSALVTISIALSPQLLSNLAYARSEALSLGTLLVAIGFFLCLLYAPKAWDGVGFAVFLFLTYQIRPSMAFLAFVFAAVALWGRHHRIKSVLFSLAPLILFCSLRWWVVGDFALVSYSGTNLVGHAMMNVDAATVQQLPPQYRVLGEKLLKRKNVALSGCTTTPSQSMVERIALRFPCHNFLQMTAWQLLVEERYRRVPFSDPQLNIEPWKHTQTLSGYFSVPNVEMDQTLMGFSKEVIRLHWQSYAIWVVSAFIFAVRESFSQLGTGWVIAIAAAWITYFTTASRRNLSQSTPHVALLCIAVSFFLVGNFTTVLLSVPNVRYYQQFSVLLLPTVWTTMDALVSHAIIPGNLRLSRGGV